MKSYCLWGQSGAAVQYQVDSGNGRRSAKLRGYTKWPQLPSEAPSPSGTQYQPNAYTNLGVDSSLALRLSSLLLEV